MHSVRSRRSFLNRTQQVFALFDYLFWTGKYFYVDMSKTTVTNLSFCDSLADCFVNMGVIYLKSCHTCVPCYVANKVEKEK